MKEFKRRFYLVKLDSGVLMPLTRFEETLEEFMEYFNLSIEDIITELTEEQYLNLLITRKEK